LFSHGRRTLNLIIFFGGVVLSAYGLGSFLLTGRASALYTFGLGIASTLYSVWIFRRGYDARPPVKPEDGLSPQYRRYAGTVAAVLLAASAYLGWAAWLKLRQGEGFVAMVALLGMLCGLVVAVSTILGLTRRGKRK
jgi:hypothetical protein